MLGTETNPGPFGKGPVGPGSTSVGKLPVEPVLRETAQRAQLPNGPEKSGPINTSHPGAPSLRSDSFAEGLLQLLDSSTVGTTPSPIPPWIKSNPQQDTWRLLGVGGSILESLNKSSGNLSSSSAVTLGEGLVAGVTGALKGSMDSLSNVKKWVDTEVAKGDLESAKVELAKLEAKLRLLAQAATSNPGILKDADTQGAVYRAAQWLKLCQERVEQLSSPG